MKVKTKNQSPGGEDGDQQHQETSMKKMNGKGFGGTYPLAPPCARSYEMGILTLQRKCDLSVLSTCTKEMRVSYLSLWLERRRGEGTPCWRLRRRTSEGFSRGVETLSITYRNTRK